MTNSSETEKATRGEEVRAIDSHVHLSRSAYGLEQAPEDYLRLMEKHRVGKAVVSTFTPEDLDFERANRVIRKIVSDHPDKFAGAAAADPRLQDRAVSTLRESLESKGFIAIILNPFEQCFKANDYRFLAPVMNIAERYGVPVIIESGFPIVSTPLQVGALAARYRSVPVVMTHSGQLLASGQSESDALAAMVQNPNLYAETSQVILTGIGGFMEQLAKSDKADRIIFGSDSPLCDVGVEFERVAVSSIPEDEKKRILRDNSVLLFGLDDFDD